MLNFTRQERVVIYFLIVTLGVGAILKMVRNQHLEEQMIPTRFYEEEQEFKEISAQINSNELLSIESSSDKALSKREAEVSSAAGLENGSKLINLNSAEVETLTKLPGIGPALAKRIRAYTDQNGPFKNKSQIVLVKGIGEKLYARIEGLVTTE